MAKLIVNATKEDGSTQDSFRWQIDAMRHCDKMKDLGYDCTIDIEQNGILHRVEFYDSEQLLASAKTPDGKSFEAGLPIDALQGLFRQYDNEDLFQEFNELCQPLMQWLTNNYHPHTKVIIENDVAELVEGVMSARLRSN